MDGPSTHPIQVSARHESGERQLFRPTAALRVEHPDRRLHIRHSFHFPDTLAFVPAVLLADAIRSHGEDYLVGSGNAARRVCLLTNACCRLRADIRALQELKRHAVGVGPVALSFWIIRLRNCVRDSES
jgi:hypothetical protein